MTQRHLASFALAGLALVAVAWFVRSSDGRTGPPGKSGGTAGVVMRLAVLEYPGKPAAQIAERYAQRVEDLSNGSIRVTIAYWPTRFERTTPSSRVEASAIRAVRAGEPQLGLIPSHAFEAQGVTTFRSMQAPLVITSAAQAARVTMGALADRLQAGLTALGLTGLGLVPEGLQRPFGFLKPLVSPADFAAVTIRADSSRATRDVLRILGARPVGLDVAGSDTSVYSGFVNDAASLPNADDDFPQAAHTVGNIALFPKVDVLVASTGAFGRLRPEQQAVLRRAAVEARAASIPAAGESTAAAAFCRAGGTSWPPLRPRCVHSGRKSHRCSMRCGVIRQRAQRSRASSGSRLAGRRFGHAGRPSRPARPRPDGYPNAGARRVASPGRQLPAHLHGRAASRRGRR